MQKYQQDFIDFVLEVGALKFGSFELKSGRTSPYFFNAGMFNTGEYLTKLGEFYAIAIVEKKLDFDLLFGPAYKGIPLASSTAVALYNKFNININYSFNRKEAKTHGEGGNIVGAKLKDKVVIIDDVITAGTAITESMAIINNHQAEVTSVIVALDRQEKGKKDTSAIMEAEAKFNIKVHSIINLKDIISYLKQGDDKKLISDIENYRNKYGV